MDLEAFHTGFSDAVHMWSSRANEMSFDQFENIFQYNLMLQLSKELSLIPLHYIGGTYESGSNDQIDMCGATSSRGKTSKSCQKTVRNNIR